jgi:hypothetical protein
MVQALVVRGVLSFHRCLGSIAIKRNSRLEITAFNLSGNEGIYW